MNPAWGPFQRPVGGDKLGEFLNCNVAMLRCLPISANWNPKKCKLGEMATKPPPVSPQAKLLLAQRRRDVPPACPEEIAALEAVNADHLHEVHNGLDDGHIVEQRQCTTPPPSRQCSRPGVGPLATVNGEKKTPKRNINIGALKIGDRQAGIGDSENVPH